MTKMSCVKSFVDSSPLLHDASALRRRSAADGYLYFGRLLKSAAIVEVRRQVLEVCRQHGFLNPRSPLLDGIVCDDPQVTRIEFEDPARWIAYYKDVLRLRDFHALGLAPELLGTFERIFGEPVLPHSRNIFRTMFPQSSQFTTPAHQDFVHIKGTKETWTAWIPCGDCPEELGGLAIVPGSHKWGLLPTHSAYGAGNTGVQVPADSPWVAGPLTCGDVLIFPSLTVHQGRDNVSGNRLRLSLDFRYQPLSQPIHPSSMQPHGNYLTWSEIYANWPADDPVRDYWKNWELHYLESPNAQ